MSWVVMTGGAWLALCATALVVVALVGRATRHADGRAELQARDAIRNQNFRLLAGGADGPAAFAGCGPCAVSVGDAEPGAPCPVCGDPLEGLPHLAPDRRAV